MAVWRLLVAEQSEYLGWRYLKARSDFISHSSIVVPEMTQDVEQNIANARAAGSLNLAPTASSQSFERFAASDHLRIPARNGIHLSNLCMCDAGALPTQSSTRPPTTPRTCSTASLTFFPASPWPTAT